MAPDRDDIELRIRAHCDHGEHGPAATLAIEAYGPDLLRFIAALLHDPDAASDVFSQVCEDLWRGLPQMKWNSSFRTWSYAVARNASYSHLRSPAHRKSVSLSDASEVERLADSVRASTLPYLRTNVKDRFAQLRATLTPDEQSLLTLRVDRGLEWNEIAQILSEAPIPEVAMKRASAACRKRFERLSDRLRELATAAGLLRPEEEA